MDVSQHVAIDPRRASGGLVKLRVMLSRWWVRVLLVCFTLALVARFTCPPLLEPYTFSREVTDRDGKLLRLTLAEDQTYRVWTPLDRFSPHLVEATQLYEDRWFYWHPGVNPVALVKAATETFSGGRRRGGSTLTMQLARMRFHIDSHTVPGKLQQMARAVQLELRYSKRELLEAYLNLAPYGGNVEGAGTAARIYFRKSASELTLAEALALSVLPQSPSVRTPGAGEEPKALHAARVKLGGLWLAAHPGTDEDTLALRSPLTLASTKELPFLAPHAVERALRTREGRTLTLTLDGALQARLERQVASYLERRASAGIHNTAVLIADAETGEVLAHVGSADFHNASLSGQVDGAASPRSPGSALKPVVYARALDEGLIHPRTLLRDVPTRFGAYNPENFDNQYLGPMTAAEALARSRNVPAVDLNLRLERDLHAVLTQTHVKGLRSKDHYGAGIVLGAVEVTMEELVSLYVALARGGQWAPLKRVRGEASVPTQSIVSAEAAELTLSMLSSHDPTRERAGVKVAWKTGTSYAYRDAWTAGVVGRYVLAVWVGNFDGAPNAAFEGRKAAAPLFFEIVDGLRPQLATPEGQRHAPDVSLTEIEVCSVSGKKPGPHCQHTARTRVIPGVSPLGTCDVHRAFPVDVRSGERQCVASASTREEVFEVWPSDVARLFALAGLPRKTPPPVAGVCESDVIVARAPRILSPQPGVTYRLRRDKKEESRVLLLAHADGAARTLTWFAGSELLGTVKAGEPLDWAAPSGQHELRAVDDRGGIATVKISVAWNE